MNVRVVEQGLSTAAAVYRRHFQRSRLEGVCALSV